jgi:hypothetical protein
MASELGARLIFVGGPPRSGTTLVQKVLSAHPDVAGAGEFDFLPRIVELRNQMRASVRSGRISEHTSEETVDEAFATLVEHLLLPLADRRQRQFVAEIAALFPAARFSWSFATLGTASHHFSTWGSHARVPPGRAASYRTTATS